jgi:hypothetical protein
MSAAAWASDSTLTPASVDVERLERAEARGVDAEVRFDLGTRALHATDGSNSRPVPLGAVLPRTVDAIEGIVVIGRAHRAPILPRDRGTGLAGQSVNAAVVLDTSKYLRAIESLDADRRVTTVPPGVVPDELREAANPVGRTFASDPPDRRAQARSYGPREAERGPRHRRRVQPPRADPRPDGNPRAARRGGEANGVRGRAGPGG